MKKFNPDKELYKIQNRKKNKIIVSLSVLLLIVVISYSFALYQVRHTQKLVFNTVGEFKKRDIYLSVLVDGETKSEFPGKDDGYVFDNIICDKPGIEASFNNDTWELTLTTGTTNKCTVKFITKPYMDDSGANYPDLFEGLIPIRFDEQNKMYIADYQQKWYDYNNHEWANAVLIDHTNEDVMNKFYTDGKLNVNQEITEEEILQMYVWIPRYKYQLFNAVAGETATEQMINIEFENTIETTGTVICKIANNGEEFCQNAENGNWYTHPAFKFGDTELRGIWIGKFETSHSTLDLSKRNLLNCVDNNCLLANDITVLPNKPSLFNNGLDKMYYAILSINHNENPFNLKRNEINVHPMKNSEWGVVAYLTSSKYGRYLDKDNCISSGCVVYNNNAIVTTSVENYGNSITGCSAKEPKAEMIYDSTKCEEGYDWRNLGVNASTTGNVYGIYDMAGGSSEFTMGILVQEDSSFTWDTEIFTPQKKYYDAYKFGTSYGEIERGHLGDATRETRKTYLTWEDTMIAMPYNKEAIFARGGRADTQPTSKSIFNYIEKNLTKIDRNIRVVLTAQDGNE